MNFYSLYSKSQQRYNVPFLAVDDGDAIDKVAKMVSMQNDPALVMSLDDLRLDQVATFDAEDDFPVDRSCICTILNDLHTDLPLPPTVKQMVDKYYAGGAQNAE